MTSVLYTAQSKNIKHSGSTRKLSKGSRGGGGLIRLSSSLILIDPLNRVLLVQRSSALTMSFSNAHVFPGGNLDSKQDVVPEWLIPGTPESMSQAEGLQLQLKLCAIRETFEETGVLLIRPLETGIGGGVISKEMNQQKLRLAEDLIPKSTLEHARKAIYKGELLFTAFLERHNVTIDLSTLHPFTTWITPANNPKRYHTKMYIMLSPTIHPDYPPEQSLSLSPPPVSKEMVEKDNEITSTMFTHPTYPLLLNQSGALTFFPPQFYILTHLARILPLPPPPPSSSLSSTPSSLPLNPSHQVQTEKAILALSRKFKNTVITPYVKASLPDGTGRVALALDNPGSDEENFVSGSPPPPPLFSSPALATVTQERHGDEENLILVKFTTPPLEQGLPGQEKKKGPPVPQQLELVKRVPFLENLKRERMEREEKEGETKL